MSVLAPANPKPAIPPSAILRIRPWQVRARDGRSTKRPGNSEADVPATDLVDCHDLITNFLHPNCAPSNSLISSASQDCAQFLFPGQRNSAWRLDTTLERRIPAGISFVEYYRTIFRVTPEISTYSGASWAVPSFSSPVGTRPTPKKGSKSCGNAETIRPAAHYAATNLRMYPRTIL
jgi:hypothetical protein